MFHFNFYSPAISKMVGIVSTVAILVFNMAGVSGQLHPCGVTEDARGQLLDCTDLNLDTFPTGLPENTIDLDLSRNPISKLPLIADINLPSLQTLTMQSCVLSSLPPMAFAFARQLKILILTGNQISQISIDAFLLNTDLEVISLDDNALDVLPSNIFTMLRMRVLDLGGNDLRVLPDQAFMGASIQSLNLEQNRISVLSRQTLEPLRSSLQYLTLKDNGARLQIEDDAFEGFKLGRLELLNSRVENIEFLQYVDSMYIDLSNNPGLITQRFSHRDHYTSVQQLHMRNISLGTSNSIFGFLDNFRDVIMLDLSYNNLASFSANTLGHLKNLEELYLDHNKLTRVPSNLGVNIPDLLELHLANNSISVLNAAHLEDMSLEVLNLENNNIQLMHASLREAFQDIDTLMFNNNPLHCNCEMRWFRELMAVASGYVGVDECASPRKVDMWDLRPEDFACVSPNITYIVENVTEPEGGEAFLTCVAQGDPAPFVEWESPSQEVLSVTPPQDRTHYKTSVYWHLSRLQKSHIGVYTCTATNLQETVKKSIYLSVYTDTTPTVPPVTTSTTSTTTTTTTPTPTTTTTTTTTTTAIPTPPPTTTTTTTTTTTSPTVTASEASTTNPESVTGVLENLTDAPGFSRQTLIIIVAVVVGAVVLILVLIVLICMCHRHRNKGEYIVEAKHFLYEHHNGHTPNHTPHKGYMGNGSTDRVSSV